MTPSIDQTLHRFANLLPNWTLLPILTLLPNFGGFHRTLQRVRLANGGRLLLRTPGPVPFGTCICSNVETIFSWTCHVYGPYEFRTSLGTSILLCLEVRKHEINRACAFHSFISYFKIQTQLTNWCSISLLFHQPYLERPRQTSTSRRRLYFCRSHQGAFQNVTIEKLALSRF